MQTISYATHHLLRLCPNFRCFLAVIVAALHMLVITKAVAETACPWEVHKLSKHYLPKHFRPNTHAFKFIYYGVDPSPPVFYGFSTAVDTINPEIGDLNQFVNLNARRLQPIPNERKPKAYALTDHADTTAMVYLVTASAEIASLEQINARIQPHPLSIKRGPKDKYGPLPPQALPVVPIASHPVSSTMHIRVCAGVIDPDIMYHELFKKQTNRSFRASRDR